LISSTARFAAKLDRKHVVSEEKKNSWKSSTNSLLVGGFNPFEKYYSSQIGNLRQVGVKIENI